MIQQNTPFYTMTMKSSESLMGDLEHAMASVAQNQIKTKTRFQNWKAVASTPKDAQAGQLFEAGMMGFFLDFLFGMPMFSGMSEMTKGMAQLGLMAHSDAHSETKHAPLADINALISSQRVIRDGALSGQSMQAMKLKKMQQMVMLMVMAMMMSQESGEGSSGGDEMMAPDVLRHPKLARFKQNRHSLACIRDMFQSQASSVAPVFNAPRCQAA